MKPLDRLFRVKLALLATLLIFVGLGLLIFGHWIQSEPAWAWLRNWPIIDIGSGLFTTGLLGVAWQYLDGQDSEARDTERLQRVLADSAPAMRDAVVRGFALQPEDLQRVATPELLDQIATNVLSLRLGDEQFAAELYAEFRDQAVRAPERWYDVQVNVGLSTAVERGAMGAPHLDRPELLDVLVEWEYTTIPSHSSARFACTSDRDDFYGLVTDVPATSTWFMTPRAGLDASAQECFELLYFAVDGEERQIRRSGRKLGQTYAVTIGQDIVDAGEPVRIKHVYRAVTPADTHRLFIEIPQPARNVSLEIDYAGAGIAAMTVSDLVSSTRKPQITMLPEGAGQSLGIDVPGWLLPRAGFTFVWTLTSERPSVVPSGRTSAGAVRSAGRSSTNHRS